MAHEIPVRLAKVPSAPVGSAVTGRVLHVLPDNVSIIATVAALVFL